MYFCVDVAGSGSEDEDAEAAEVEEALVLKQQMHTLLTKEAFGLGDSVDVAQDAPEVRLRVGLACAVALCYFFKRHRTTTQRPWLRSEICRTGIRLATGD